MDLGSNVTLHPSPKAQLTSTLHAGAQQGLHENWPVKSCVQEPHKRTSCQESTASPRYLNSGGAWAEAEKSERNP